MLLKVPGENFFMVKDGKIFTPDVEASLNGITRKSIIDLAKNEKIDVIEKNISPEEVIQADELFFTGTAAEVLPITLLIKIKYQMVKEDLLPDSSVKIL